MAEVVTLVTGTIPADRQREVVERYRAGVGNGLPPAIEETFLLRSGGDTLGILSVWHRRADLEAVLGSGEEPFARRLIREAGGTPEVSVHEIVERAGSPGTVA